MWLELSLQSQMLDGSAPLQAVDRQLCPPVGRAQGVCSLRGGAPGTQDHALWSWCSAARDATATEAVYQG